MGIYHIPNHGHHSSRDVRDYVNGILLGKFHSAYDLEQILQKRIIVVDHIPNIYSVSFEDSGVL